MSLCFFLIGIKIFFDLWKFVYEFLLHFKKFVWVDYKWGLRVTCPCLIKCRNVNSLGTRVRGIFVVPEWHRLSKSGEHSSRTLNKVLWIASLWRIIRVNKAIKVMRNLMIESNMISRFYFLNDRPRQWMGSNLTFIDAWYLRLIVATKG